MDDKITVKEAAKKIRRTPAALYEAIKTGRLAHEIVYGRVVVSLADVRRYKQETKSGPKSSGDKKCR
jgi:hypothetical protein